jgi:ribosomal protein L4
MKQSPRKRRGRGSDQGRSDRRRREEMKETKRKKKRDARVVEVKENNREKERVCFPPKVWKRGRFASRCELQSNDVPENNNTKV